VKTNLPVTGVERPCPKGKIIVSRTDLKGVITYANDPFVEISGFTRNELIGKNHNIVRHPDMPPEAFDDLWTTIKDGRPWRGMVKNRCKNGDHYWVKALVVSVQNQHQVLGYMSVRTEPTRKEVESAEKLYKDVREKRRRLRNSNSLFGRMLQLPFNVRYTLFAMTMALMAAGAGMSGLAGWKLLTLALVFAAVVLAAMSVIFMAYTVSRPLKKMMEHFQQIGQGNLDNDIDVTGLDEAGQVLTGLAATQVHLRVIIDEIRASVEILKTRCTELETEVEQVASHSRSQSDRIAQVSVAMEQVSVSVTEVARNAQGAAEASRATLAIVNEGNQRMSQSLSNTDQVVAAVQTSSEGIDRLSDAVGNIGTVTRMIKDIAEQTNLLALNAAIEAARAGEHGRGFAVVADEVRKLAERTSHSTEDIDRMVAGIQATTVSAVDSMRIAAERVSEGRALIGETYDSFKKITEASAEVTRVSTHIASAAKEQSAATDEVAKNTEHMSELIERNAASLQQVELAVAGLRQTAGQLHGTVAQFNT
jgi:aerotaxis receptor